jgi:hypothetical protein
MMDFFLHRISAFNPPFIVLKIVHFDRTGVFPHAITRSNMIRPDDADEKIRVEKKLKIMDFEIELVLNVHKSP